MVACCPGLEYAKGHTKLLEITKNQALIQANENFDRKIEIPIELKAAFNWCKGELLYGIRKIRDLSFYIEIYSDAWVLERDGKKLIY